MVQGGEHVNHPFNEHLPQLHELVMHDRPDHQRNTSRDSRAKQKHRDTQIRQARRRKQESFTRPQKEKKDN